MRSRAAAHTIGNMEFKRLSTAVCLLLLSANPAAAGDIFVGTQEQDSVVLSNVPTDENFSIFVRAPIEALPPAAPATGERGVEPRGTRAIMARAATYAPLVEEVARQARLDPVLLHAVIATESAYNPQARSPKGARGLMQLMPATARRYGVVDAYEPRNNILGGARYLADLMTMFDQDVQLALAAYNAGEQAVIRHGRRVPPYRETGAYVPRVLDYYRVFSKVSM